MDLPRRLARAFLLGLLLFGLMPGGRARALAPELGASQIDRLFAGHPVVLEDTIETPYGRYVGGVTYLVVNAPISSVVSVLENVGDYVRILPYTRRARWIGLSRAGDALVELDQGISLAHGRYAIRIRRNEEGDGGATFRFWLDGRYPHAIADANGFFHVEPVGDGRTLVTLMVLVNLGPGIFRRLFENRIRRAALSAPMLLKRHVEELPRR